MAAMKPRTGDGPLEVTKEGRGIVMRVPLEGGGRLVVELSADEAGALGDAPQSVVAGAPPLPGPGSVHRDRPGAECCRRSVSVVRDDPGMVTVRLAAPAAEA